VTAGHVLDLEGHGGGIAFGGGARLSLVGAASAHGKTSVGIDDEQTMHLPIMGRSSIFSQIIFEP
jgi:hypothetical protein